MTTAKLESTLLDLASGHFLAIDPRRSSPTRNYRRILNYLNFVGEKILMINHKSERIFIRQSKRLYNMSTRVIKNASLSIYQSR